MRKPLPLGEVSAKQTERASPSPESRCAAISRPFVRAMLSLRLRFTGSVLALSGAPRQLSQRESLLHPVRLNREPKSPRHVLSRVGGFLMRAIQFLCRYSSLCLAACDIMFVILHIIVAEHGHKLGVVCLVGIQVKLAASAAAFLHAAGHKVVE